MRFARRFAPRERFAFNPDSDVRGQSALISATYYSDPQGLETLAACFGRKSQKRTDQITGILATLKALGHIY